MNERDGVWYSCLSTFVSDRGDCLACSLSIDFYQYSDSPDYLCSEIVEYAQSFRIHFMYSTVLALYYSISVENTIANDQSWWKVKLTLFGHFD
jgi:hypothetical protein